MNTDPEIVRWLCALKNHGSKFGVDRMALFDARLGAPSRAFPAIHVAGSNGKGSTCAMLEAVFRARGLRTGLYTSPHLVRLGERVQVCREPLSDADVCAHVGRLRPVAERIGAANPEDAPSFFEFMTAMAFLEFQRRAVDVAIVETGLGGRLDATNILAPRVSVITSISLEHTEYLGGSLERIAQEKGGIIKPGVPVVLGAVPPEAEAVLHAIAQARGAPVFGVHEVFSKAGAALPETNLAGAHQRSNAALALLAASVFDGVEAGGFRGWRGGATGIPAGFRTVLERDARALRAVDWPARWQVFPLPRGRRLILDAAHNAECAGAIEPLLAGLARATGRKPVIIAGALGLARARALLDVFSRHAAALHLVCPEQERACSFEELEACVPADFSGPVSRSSLGALFPDPGECALGEEGQAVVAAGSVYLAGEILSRFSAGSTAGGITLQDRLPPPVPVFQQHAGRAGAGG
jgi:dihydrofolate synthase/folylpolyglutamate synthase